MKYALALAVLIVLAGGQALAEPLKVVYPPRPPYNYSLAGKPTGILLDLAERILASAGIEAEFSEMPSGRILREMAQPGGKTCSFGWYKTAQREAFAWFSRPFYRDTPLVAVVLKKNVALLEGKPGLAAMCADETLSLGVVRGWSYGAAADAAIAVCGPRRTEVNGRRQQALMLANDRFTHTLVRQAEVEELVRLTGLPAGEFAVLPLSDGGEPGERRFMCAKDVGPEVTTAIDAAIDQLRLDGD